MLLTPNELAKIIELLARDEAAALGGVALTYQAEHKISAVPPRYPPADRIDVDMNRLKSTIKDVIKQAYLVNPSIDAPAIDEALQRVKCHYLWF